MMNRTIAARHYLGSANASVWQANVESSGLPGVRTVVRRDVTDLYQKFMDVGCNREDYRHHATAVISTQLWLNVLTRCGVTASTTRDPCQQLQTLNFLADERFTCVQGRIRICAARMFENHNDHWWPFDFYSDGM